MHAVFIGHSFFKPYAELMPEYTANAGIAGHSQTIVFSGGSSGTPEALWNNASKKLAITNALDTGDVELFCMTYHPDYPENTGYVDWITYALGENPSTRFCIALPWIPQPSALYGCSLLQQSGKRLNPVGIHSLTVSEAYSPILTSTPFLTDNLRLNCEGTTPLVNCLR